MVHYVRFTYLLMLTPPVNISSKTQSLRGVYKTRTEQISYVHVYTSDTKGQLDETRTYILFYDNNLGRNNICWLIFDWLRCPLKLNSKCSLQVYVRRQKCNVLNIRTHREYTDAVRVRCQIEEVVREGQTQ